MLMPSEFSATAFLRSLRGTSSGTMDCQVGPISAAPMPPTKVSATRYSTVSVLVRASSRLALTAASRIWMPIRKRRRSRMSDRTPAGIASRKMGSGGAVWIRATAAGLADSSVTIQELATSRMKLPMLPSTVAAHSTANTGWRSGAKLPEAVAAGRVESAVMALSQVMPGDEQEAADQAQMLEEGIGRHQALLPCGKLPEAQRDEGGQQRERGQRQGAQPAQPAGDDHGRGAQLQRELQRAREIALKELEERAQELGANAVVGVDLDYEVLGQGN